MLMAAPPLATTLAFDHAEDFAAALRSASVHYVSLAPGPYRASLTLMEVAGLRVQRAVDAPHLTQGAVADGEHVLLLPFGAVNDTRLNGRPITSEDAVLLGPGSDLFARVGTTLSWCAVSIPQEAVEALALDVPRPGQFHHLRGLLARAPALSLRLAEALAAGQAGTAIARGSPAAGVLAEDLRHALVQALAGPFPGAKANRATHRHMAVVRRTDEVMRSLLGHPISTAEICAALEVPERTLRAAFAAVHGISLHAYLRMRRLDLARASLLRAQRAPGRVKSAALSHGFWHLGRFSAEYQARFGESPSMTGRGGPDRDEPGGGPASLIEAAAAAEV